MAATEEGPWCLKLTFTSLGLLIVPSIFSTHSSTSIEATQALLTQEL